MSLRNESGSAPAGNAGAGLLAASFAALAMEMALIRWLPGEVRVVSYFPNLVLIAAFLGLGAGALARKRSPVAGGLLMLALILSAAALSRVAFTSSGTSEHLWLLYYDLPKGAPVFNSVLPPLAAVFVLVAALFVPLGGEIGARLEGYRIRGRPLSGYAIDLLGSLSGVVAFLGLSAVGSRPVVWFGVAFAAWVAASNGTWRRRGALAVMLGAALAVVHLTDRADFYSPYYALRTVDGNSGDVMILANGSLHQQAVDLRTPRPEDDTPLWKTMRTGYRFPVEHLSKVPKRALVLGAGSGNDVATLIDAGVPEIHVVEIDPAIVEIGRRRHPSQPYSDPRVVVHIADARSFLEQTDLRFDLIVFGTLDSMTRLSALSNVRLDNFVYTVESIRMARSRLTPDGGVALMFMAANEEIAQRLYAIVARAFDAPPLVYRHNHNLFNLIFMAGPGFASQYADATLRMKVMEELADRMEAPTDDWPYLYLSGRGVPVFYLELSGIVLLAGVLLLAALSRSTRLEMAAGRIDWEMIVFGTAFLLVETALVTELNLLFGAVWRTSGIVFASILLALLASTVISARRMTRTGRAPDPRLPLLGATLSLLAIALLHIRGVAPAGLAPRIVFAAVVCGLPVFCAGFAFSARFAARASAEAAFGWNIVGAVIGGLLEFSTMLLGLRAMFVLAAILYLLLLLTAARRHLTLQSSPR